MTRLWLDGSPRASSTSTVLFPGLPTTIGVECEHGVPSTSPHSVGLPIHSFMDLDFSSVSPCSKVSDLIRDLAILSWPPRPSAFIHYYYYYYYYYYYSGPTDD
jgi:hypothetical protein